MTKACVSYVCVLVWCVTEMNDTSGRWSYARQLYGHVYTAKIGTLSELVTAGDQFNQQHITLAGYEKETQTPADELAASRTARAAVFIRNDPARPTQTGELVGMLAKVPQSSVDQMSPADLNAAAWLVAGFFLQA